MNESGQNGGGAGFGGDGGWSLVLPKSASADLNLSVLI